jgi:hypothetical protein
MEDVRIKFYGISETQNHTLECYHNGDGIFIEISCGQDNPYFGWIELNKATAVQLVKKLKLEISKFDNHG